MRAVHERTLSEPVQGSIRSLSRLLSPLPLSLKDSKRLKREGDAILSGGASVGKRTRNGGMRTIHSHVQGGIGIISFSPLTSRSYASVQSDFCCEPGEVVVSSKAWICCDIHGQHTWVRQIRQSLHRTGLGESVIADHNQLGPTRRAHVRRKSREGTRRSARWRRQ
jgi:hypothetical protein